MQGVQKKGRITPLRVRAASESRIGTDFHEILGFSQKYICFKFLNQPRATPVLPRA